MECLAIPACSGLFCSNVVSVSGEQQTVSGWHFPETRVSVAILAIKNTPCQKRRKVMGEVALDLPSGGCSKSGVGRNKKAKCGLLANLFID